MPPKTKFSVHLNITLSNLLSCLRAPLAFLFLIENVRVRVCVIVLAAFSDIIDGHLARRFQTITKLGAILDPLMDKFFVFFVLFILYKENDILPWQILSMLARDLSLFLFGLFLLFRKQLINYNYHSLITGKMTTALQFLVLLLISLRQVPPVFLFFLFFFLGILVLVELFLTLKTNPEKV